MELAPHCRIDQHCPLNEQQADFESATHMFSLICEALSVEYYTYKILSIDNYRYRALEIIIGAVAASVSRSSCFR